MDLTGIAEAFASAFRDVPPLVIALGLLAGPTLALIIYQLIGLSRRIATSGDVRANALWVCRDCRSANELRRPRCYKCGLHRDALEKVELIVDQPGFRTAMMIVPLEQPPAPAAPAVAQAEKKKGPSKPVMADPATGTPPVAVGPGRKVTAVRKPPQPETGTGVSLEAES